MTRKPLRQKYHGGRTAVIITRCTPDLKRRIRAEAAAQGITVGRLIVERMTRELEGK